MVFSSTMYKRVGQVGNEDETHTIDGHGEVLDGCNESEHSCREARDRLVDHDEVKKSGSLSVAVGGEVSERWNQNGDFI